MLSYLNNKLHTPTWLFALLSLILVLRIPSLFEPYSYGDELIYLTLGEGMRQGITLYSGIHDNKPPLLYLTAAIAGNLFWFKAILAFWNLVTIYIFWKLSEFLLPKNLKAQKIATIIFAILTTIPLLEGNIANAELFMIGPTMLAFYILLAKKTSVRNLIFSGFLFSIAALYKIPAAFDIPAIIIYWICLVKKIDTPSIIKISKKTFLLIVSFLFPIALTFVWYYLQGAFKEYLIAAFLQNFGYLSSWRPSDVHKPFLEKNGPLIFRGLIVLISSLILYLNRKKISKEFLFTTSWMFFSLFAVALSERPYPHYLVQSVAPLSILITILFTSARIEQIYSIVPLFFFFLVPYYFHFWHYETISYYQRFLKYASSQMTTTEYLNTFGGNVERNYKVAKYISSFTKPGEKIFVSGDGVPIYALSKRLPPVKFVADYHISDFSSDEEIVRGLSKNPPIFIVILSGKSSAYLDNFVASSYGHIDTIEDAEIWKLLKPEVRSQLSF